MIYQLTNFEQWVRLTIAPDIIKDSTEEDLKGYIQFANLEKDRICGYFRDKAIGKPPEPTLQFIHTHQVSIANLIDVLMTYTRMEQGLVTQAMTIFYRNICLTLEEVIRFIEAHLPGYFNNEVIVTAISAEQARKELSNALQELQPIAEQPGMDEALYSMAVRTIRQFINEGGPVNYRQLKYMRELSHYLKQLIYLDAGANITYELHLILLQLNFNHSRYVLHYTYWLDARILKIQDRMCRLDELSRQIKSIEQLEVNPELIFNPKLSPLKDQLLSNIKLTYQYLLTEDKPLNHAVIEQIEKPAPPRPKIRLSISVPVLALFLKLLIRAGIILNESRHEVFKIIVDNFTTVKSERLSYGSLKGKYNKVPASAYMRIQTILDRLKALVREV